MLNKSQLLLFTYQISLDKANNMKYQKTPQKQNTRHLSKFKMLYFPVEKSTAFL